MGKLFALAVSVAVLVFWVFMLVDAVTNKGISDTERLMWVLVIIFLNLLGAVLYFFVARPKRRLGF